jgi:hypothetical protein
MPDFLTNKFPKLWRSHVLTLYVFTPWASVNVFERLKLFLSVHEQKRGHCGTSTVNRISQPNSFKSNAIQYT